MKNLQYTISAKCLLIALALLAGACSNVTVETQDNFEMLELPDGSIVFLNQNSSLEYSPEFSPREVKIRGGFYFSVAESDSPFIINGELGEIKVVGTEFGVASNKEEIEVEVEEGSVELQTNAGREKLNRGQEAHFVKGSNRIQTGEAKFKFKVWMAKLKIEFKKLGREIKRGAKKVGEESKKAGKEAKQELKKLKVN